MPSENLVSLQVSLISLAFRCYPEKINLVDKVLESTLVALDKIAVEKYVVVSAFLASFHNTCFNTGLILILLWVKSSTACCECPLVITTAWSRCYSCHISAKSYRDLISMEENQLLFIWSTTLSITKPTLQRKNMYVFYSFDMTHGLLIPLFLYRLMLF